MVRREQGSWRSEKNGQEETGIHLVRVGRDVGRSLLDRERPGLDAVGTSYVRKWVTSREGVAYRGRSYGRKWVTSREGGGVSWE